MRISTSSSILIVIIVSMILGISFPVVSLASVVPSVMTVPILYKVSREIFDQVTGLVSALIFSLAPTILWYSTVIDMRSLMLFLSVLGMWAFVKSLKANDTRFLFLFGLI